MAGLYRLMVYIYGVAPWQPANLLSEFMLVSRFSQTIHLTQLFDNVPYIFSHTICSLHVTANTLYPTQIIFSTYHSRRH